MKGKTHIIAKFLWTDLVICSHFKEGETPSYSRINMVLSEVASNNTAFIMLHCCFTSTVNI